MTASMSFCWSSMTRKSLYVLAFGYFLKTGSARAKSTSHRATMFSVALLSRFDFPIPPTPTAAMLSLSLGAGVPWPPSTCRGTMVKPAVAVAALARKVLRGTEALFLGSEGPGWFIEFS